jgi:hypothetical protein
MHDEAHASGIHGQAVLEHHMSAADHGKRHDRESGLERQEKTSAFESCDAAIMAPRSLRKHDERESAGGEP